MPALLVLDDLHLLCPAPGDAPEGLGANPGAAALVAWLVEALHQLHARPGGGPAPARCGHTGRALRSQHTTFPAHLKLSGLHVSA